MPRERSLTLTDHELRLMNVLWKRQKGTVADVVAALEPPPLAYTTVLTTLRTLEDKGYVAHDKTGRAFVYRPLVKRSDAATSLLDALLDRFFSSSPGVLALSLLEDERLSEKDIARLKQVIDRKRYLAMIAVARTLLDVLFAGLWQGAAIAIVVAVALAVAGRRISAATRYAVLEFALLAIAIVPMVTTLPNVTSHPAQVSVPMQHAAAAFALRHAAAASALTPPPRRIDVALSDRTVLGLIGAWMIGVLALCLRIVAGSLQVARLKRRSERLADRCGVRVYASPDVATPLVVGFASPSVIVPTALVTDAREEFECAMLHELAHVRRHDAWVNACDRALHALLFFNPAAVLLLRAAALEREIACDDWALSQSRDVDAYARSLATLAVRAAYANASTLAFGAVGFGRSTVTRIERLEDSRRNGATTLSRYALGGITIVLSTLALALQSLAPAVAFSPYASAPVRVASAACSNDVWVRNPVPPDLPAGMSKITHDTMAVVKVHVLPSGSVSSAKIYKSSGRVDLDRATIVASERSAYAPAMQDCKPAAGSYLFAARFKRN